MLDQTPLDPLRGIDIYMDAAGSDNWTSSNDKFYINGVIFTSARDQWVQWMKDHSVLFKGKVHFSDREFGNGEKLHHPEMISKALISKLPWAFAFVNLHHKASIADHLHSKVGGDPPRKFEITREMWRSMLPSISERFIPQINRAWGNPENKNIIRKICINNPQGADLGEVTRHIRQKLSRDPEFVPAGHPGIDALDGLLWAIRRFVELGKSDAVPWLPGERIPKQVLIFGIKGEAGVTYLQSLNAIELWKDACASA